MEGTNTIHKAVEGDPYRLIADLLYADESEERRAAAAVIWKRSPPHPRSFEAASIEVVKALQSELSILRDTAQESLAVTDCEGWCTSEFCSHRKLRLVLAAD